MTEAKRRSSARGERLLGGKQPTSNAAIGDAGALECSANSLPAPRGDHHRYVLTLSTGEQLYTRVSHGAGSYHDHGLWSHILRDQLRVTPEDFWACVEHGMLPPRPVADRRNPANAIPGQLAWQLIKKAGIPEADVRSMTKEQAVEALNRYLAELPSR